MPTRRDPISDIFNRTAAKIDRTTPLTVEERFEGFEEIGFRPYGLFLPEDKDLRATLNARLLEMGRIPDKDERDQAYVDFQEETAEWEEEGIPGRWHGQMQVALCPARFRIVAFGRRAGKSVESCKEAIVMQSKRPRSVVWVCGINDTVVSRVFEMLVNDVKDFGLETIQIRNAKNDRLIVFANGSRIEGVSLDKASVTPGASVNLAIVDEAAFVTEEMWQRIILPPLTDTEGQAILISSWEGEGNFFYQKAEEARAEVELAKLRGEDVQPLWEFFRDETWNNFFVYPGGYDDPKIQAARMELKLSPQDFLEQFGAIASGVRGRVYGEFKERVHVGHFPYRPGHPVTLVVDPSSGGAHYAVSVWQTDGPFAYQIDEYYEIGVSCEEIWPVLRRRPWHDDVEDVILDPAWPTEVERWYRPVSIGGGGYKAFGLPNKPKIMERIPILRGRLRNAEDFEHFRRRKLYSIMAEHGVSAEDSSFLPVDERLHFELLLEQSLADENLTEEDITELRACARLFINASTCPNTIKEYRLYSYSKNPSAGKTGKMYYAENPRDVWSDLMDTHGYFVWWLYRYEVPETDRPDYSYLESGFAKTAAIIPTAEELEAARTLPGPDDRARLMFANLREGAQGRRHIDYGTPVYTRT